MAEHLSEEEIDSVARGAPRPAHLSVCIECARRVRAANGRVKLLAGFRMRTLSDEALARVEHRVMEEVRRPAAPRWPVWGWGLLGVAAGLLLALYVGQPAQPLTSPQQTVAKAPKLMPVFRAVSFAAYRVEGDVAVNGGERLVAGARLKPGASFTVSSGAAWLSSVPEGVVVKTTASGAVGGKTELDMGSFGEWAMEVKSAQAHVFYSEPVWLSATDAVFRVVKTAAQVVVEVKRGTVMVSEDAMFAKTQRLDAPRVWSLPPGAASVAGEWGAPVVAGEGGEVLDVNGLPQGAMVQLGDGGFVPGPLSALLPVGAYDVGVRLPGESRVTRSKVELKVGGTSFVAPNPLEQVLPENAAAIASIPDVVLSRRPSLQPCVEKWLKNDAQARASLEIELAISPLGKVRRVAVVQGQVPAVVQQCLLRTVRGWPFPRLGGAEDTVVTLPLVLMRSGR